MVPPEFAHLAKAIEPFVGMMLDRDFTRRNGFRVDILHSVVHTMGADIREIRPEGIFRVWDCQGELIPWGDVRLIAIHELDGMRNPVSSREIKA